MKKLYNKKGKVHPSPSPPSSGADPLALLPATIFTLTLALCEEDKQVLAYLISCANNSGNIYTHHHKTAATQKRGIRGGGAEISAGGGGSLSSSSHLHPPMFQCDCFRCYTSFWARWDASPNRQLIHEIIEAYEERLVEKKRRVRVSSKVKKERRKISSNKVVDDSDGKLLLIKGSDGHLAGSGELGHHLTTKEEVKVGPQVVDVGGGAAGGGDDEHEGCEIGLEKGAMRRLVSFIGDRIWGVWNRV